MKTIEGTFTGVAGSFAIVVGRWNSFVVESLLEGACDALRRHGVSEDDITIIRAPGAFEIPLVCQKVASGNCHMACTTTPTMQGLAILPEFFLILNKSFI